MLDSCFLKHNSHTHPHTPTRTRTHVATLRPGSFLFQAVQQCEVDGVHHFEDEHGKYYGLDYRVWGNLNLQAFPAPITSTSPMAFGLLPVDATGLTDVTVWHAMSSICRQTFGPYDEPPLMIPPSLASALLTGTATGFQCDGLGQLFRESDGSISTAFSRSRTIGRFFVDLWRIKS